MNKQKFEINDKFTQNDFYNLIRDKNWLANFMAENNVKGWPMAYILKGAGYISW